MKGKLYSVIQNSKVSDSAVSMTPRTPIQRNVTIFKNTTAYEYEVFKWDTIKKKTPNILAWCNVSFQRTKFTVSYVQFVIDSQLVITNKFAVIAGSL